jgi:hypothetical protein
LGINFPSKTTVSSYIYNTYIYTHLYAYLNRL